MRVTGEDMSIVNVTVGGEASARPATLKPVSVTVKLVLLTEPQAGRVSAPDGYVHKPPAIEALRVAEPEPQLTHPAPAEPPQHCAVSRRWSWIVELVVLLLTVPLKTPRAL